MDGADLGCLQCGVENCYKRNIKENQHVKARIIEKHRTSKHSAVIMFIYLLLL